VFHWPKLAVPYAVPAPARVVPLWLPLALAMVSLGAAALAVQVSLGQTLVHQATGASAAAVEQHVLGYVNSWAPDRDPLVTMPNGAQAKSSNVYGVDYRGVRYYYQLTRQTSFDPLRLGTIRDYEVVAVVDAGTPWEVLIYRGK
jgi:hypothetical protein